MISVANGARWPLWLWSLQLLPAGFLFVFGLLRLTVGDLQNQSDDLKSAVALGAGGVWISAVLLCLLLRAGRRWVVAHRKEWCLSAVTLLVALTFADLVLTVTGLVPTLAEQRAYSVVYTFGKFSSFRLVPKTILTEKNGAIHINRRGFRGPEFEPIKAPGRIRVAFLGGSQVFDYTGDDWPAIVGEKLRARGYDIEIINAGVPGYNSADSLATLLTDLWVLEPDVVFLCNAWNDIKYFARLSPSKPYRGLPPEKPVSWLRDWRLYPTGIDKLLTISSIYRYFRVALITFFGTEEGYHMFGRTMQNLPNDLEPPGRWGLRQYRLNLEQIASLTANIGADLVLCKQAYLTEGTGTSGLGTESYVRRNTGLSVTELTHAYESCDQIIEHIAKDRGLLVVDMKRALSGRPEYFWDPIHFNPAGSRAAAEVVAAALDSHLARMQGQRP